MRVAYGPEMTAVLATKEGTQMLNKSTMLLLAGAVVLNAPAAEHGEAGNTVEKKEADKLSITPIDQTKPFFKTSLFWPNDPAIAKGEWRGPKGYPYHISAAYDGRRTIVVVAHVRTDKGFPDGAPGHVAVRRSTDFGGSWTRPEVIQPYIDWNLTASGLVYVPKHDQFIGPLFSMIEHKHGATPEKRRWIVGDRNGTEWSVRPGASRGEPQHLFVGNSQGASLRLRTGPHAGRLLIPLRHYPRTPDGKHPSRGQGNVVLYSDDHGATWQLGEPFALGAGSELGMAETSDGRLYGTLRNHGKKHWRTPRTVAHSNDGGRTWTDVGPGGPYNTTWTNGDVETYPKRLLPAGRERLMIFVNPTDDGPSRRPNHAVWFSYDDGASWPLYKIIWDVTNPEQGEGSARATSV